MEELKVGEKVTLEAIEQDVCNGCDDCFFGYDDTCYNPTYNGWGDGFLCSPVSHITHWKPIEKLEG